MKMKCTRPEWSNKKNDFCYCDHPEFNEALQHIDPCENCVWYKEDE